MRKKITVEPIKQHCGYEPKVSTFPTLKNHNYTLIRKSVGGAAPKELVRGYFYGVCRRDQRFELIAKVGHKNYPHESIGEYMMTRIGQVIGLDMAEGYLASMSGQLRYFSKNFLKSGDELIHGASILSSYFNDTSFVDLIEKEKQTRELLSFQTIEKAVELVFPEHASTILTAYVTMLAFDALIGHQDRHHYNWAVIRSVNRSHSRITFSPIYDTARGLFWNYTEERLLRDKTKMGLEQAVKKYADFCRPKTGWDSHPNPKNLNHFLLMEYILQTEYVDKQMILHMFDEYVHHTIVEMIRREFQDLMSPLRMEFILQSIGYRSAILRSVYRSLG